MAAVSTSTLELGSYNLQQPPVAVSRDLGAGIFTSETRRLGSSDERTSDDASPPSNPAPVVESWKHPRSNLFRIGAAFWSFVVSGANDAAYGVSFLFVIDYSLDPVLTTLPGIDSICKLTSPSFGESPNKNQLESYYDLSYLVVSLIFLSPFVGYILAASFNNMLHERVGQRGIGILCGMSHVIAYIVASQHPPYPVLVLVYTLAGFGNGIGDAAWNAWVGNLSRANETLGFLHAFYGVGGTISPLIATTMVTEANLPWSTFYYVLVGPTDL